MTKKTGATGLFISIKQPPAASAQGNVKDHHQGKA